MKRRKLIMMIGPPGVGKSTFIQKMANRNSFTVISTDEILMFKASQENLTYDQAWKHFSLKEIDRTYKEDLERAISNGEDIIVDKTSMSVKARNKVLCRLTDEYERIAMVFNFDDKDKLKERLRIRSEQQNKTISDSVLDDMIKSYEEPTKSEFDYIYKISNL